MEKVKVAAVQMRSGTDKEQNILRAESLIRKAAAAGAKIIALPETFSWRGRRNQVAANAETIPGPTTERLSRTAAALRIYLLAGSIVQKIAGNTRAFNTSLLFDPKGKILAAYQKIHLFQYRLKNNRLLKEDRFFKSGRSIVSAKLPFATVGLSICYDLRFPELYRALSAKGCAVMFVPSAFTLETGRLHWEVLLRARAIENQAYIIAPNQYGLGPLGHRDYGHSMIISPLGAVMAQAFQKEAIITAELDFTVLKTLRRNLPALKHVRRDIFHTH